MYNWGVDIGRLKKNKQAFEKWHLEQLINYGLGGEKISLSLLKKHWSNLEIDPKKKKYLEFLLWGKK